MKIHILFQFVDGPYGGANQFLKSLRQYFKEKNIYTCDMNLADIIIVNCSPMSLINLSYKMIFSHRIQDKYIISRIDGPVFRIRGKDLFFDQYFFRFCEQMCDMIIFQSEWSKRQCVGLGLDINNLKNTVILNSPDQSIFNRTSAKHQRNKISIVISSWSLNMKKGFEIYRHIDENIDLEKFEITFIGNSPIKFKNIKMIGAMSSKELADELSQHDCFLTASANDPCSNSLIEGMASGLLPIALRSGGHPEIVGSSGILFDDKHDLLIKLSKLTKENLEKYSFTMWNSHELYHTVIEENFYDRRPKKIFRFLLQTVHTHFLYRFFALMNKLKNLTWNF